MNNITAEFDVLIIGGGTAGLSASIELADAGMDVCLIEKDVFAGGKAKQLYKAFPTDDCFFCLPNTRLKMGIRKCFYRGLIFDHPNISLLTKTSIEDVKGQMGDFDVTLKEDVKYVDPNKCTLCKACIDACPTTLNTDTNHTSVLKKDEKAVGMPYPQCIPQAVAINRDLCKEDCNECAEVCPFEAIHLNAEKRKHVLKVKSIIISTGFNEFSSQKLINLGYSKYPNVITQIELARMLDPTGPTQGKVVRVSDGKEASNIVMIQCVGSRDERFYSYCSSLCCSYSLKHAKIIKEERNKDADISVVYMDIRTPGQLEDIYSSSRKLGIEFIRGRVATVEESKDQTLVTRVYDSILGKELVLRADLLVLATALIPSKPGFQMIEYNGDGFVSSDIDFSKTNIDGIFCCGTIVNPMDISFSTTTARAAAFNVISELKRNK
jgi:heterodisulfide reductase subunit A-like polyferredoxin